MSEQDREKIFGDTIAAISTPAGEGAIAIIRVSGPDAIAIAHKIFRGKERPAEFPSHTQRLGELVDQSERCVDQVLLSVHRAPHSYTGEDLIEISCHGGMLVSARVLEVCLQAGARAAGPGEFTERSFLNGKMDLTQAEAVMDLIRAQSDLALRSATEQLRGRLGAQVKIIRDELVALVAQLEAEIEFPAEGIEPDSDEKLQARFDSVREKISALLATAAQGRILREGVRAVIYGATNAGKSSLLNRLLGYDRAIVSETPGTTRDTIEEQIILRGVPLRLVDTAGLRASDDHVEREGILRTEKSRETADLLLHILDLSAPRPPDLGESGNGNELVILNKSDLPEHDDWKNHEGLRISCRTGVGIEMLEQKILDRIAQQHLQPESSLAINARHRDCFRRALDACDRAVAAMNNGVSAEYLTVDLQDALRALGEIIGATGVEEILDSVFGQFCIGK